jgi:hypothetical protein
MGKMAAELIKVTDIKLSFQDIAAKQGVEIDIRSDGLVVWINVDGVCRTRIITNGITVPITVEDGRL